jgi:hypothetical protein
VVCIHNIPTIHALSISGVNAINPLIAFYDIHGRKRKVSFILSRTPHETIGLYVCMYSKLGELVNLFSVCNFERRRSSGEKLVRYNIQSNFPSLFVLVWTNLQVRVSARRVA